MMAPEYDAQKLCARIGWSVGRSVDAKRDVTDRIETSFKIGTNTAVYDRFYRFISDHFVEFVLPNRPR